jgi:hypothetical protein
MGPEKSEKSKRVSQKGSAVPSHKMERKSSQEAKSILVENESGHGVHHQDSNADLHEIANAEMK